MKRHCNVCDGDVIPEATEQGPRCPGCKTLFPEEPSNKLPLEPLELPGPSLPGSPRRPSNKGRTGW
ncbi:MAG TPA: hypothetical protein VJH94_03025 [Candidatus Paceibacterota bacterium]